MQHVQNRITPPKGLYSVGSGSRLGVRNAKSQRFVLGGGGGGVARKGRHTPSAEHVTYVLITGRGYRLQFRAPALWWLGTQVFEKVINFYTAITQ